MEVWALAGSRSAALLNVVVALSTAAGQSGHFGGAVLLAAVLVAESAGLTLLARRRGELPPGIGAADLAVGCVALAVNGLLVSGTNVHTWGFFAYPYTLVGSCATGLVFPRLSQVLGGSFAYAAVYTVTDHAASGQPLWNAVPNAGSYLGIAPVVWAIARQLRGMAGELDTERAFSLALARKEAALKERAQHARLLHDRVLQTMETLARGSWVQDSWMRDQVRAEADWVRWLVENGPQAERIEDLGGALRALAQERIRRGLRVTVRFPPPPGDDFRPVPGEVADALLAATHEALTNVAKHAGVDRASVRAAMEEGAVVITVTDRGRGFDLAATPAGVGLTQSVRSRLTEVGGEALVESEPGGGTCVELRVPVRVP
jgi:signal transduction histidine kinase